MKTHGKSVKRWLSILLCCMLLLLPLGMTAGAVQEEGPEYQEDLSRSMYITTPDYGLDRTGTKQLKLHFYTSGITDTVTPTSRFGWSFAAARLGAGLTIGMCMPMRIPTATCKALAARCAMTIRPHLCRTATMRPPIRCALISC